MPGTTSSGSMRSARKQWSLTPYEDFKTCVVIRMGTYANTSKLSPTFKSSSERWVNLLMMLTTPTPSLLRSPPCMMVLFPPSVPARALAPPLSLLKFWTVHSGQVWPPSSQIKVQRSQRPSWMPKLLKRGSAKTSAKLSATTATRKDTDLKRNEAAKDNATSAKAKEDQAEAWAAIKQISGPEDKVLSDAVTATAGWSLMKDQVTLLNCTTSKLYNIYNSGALQHMSPLHEQFVSYWEIHPCAITAADKRVFYAVGCGDLRIEVPNGESRTPILPKNVLHAPEIDVTIVSINHIAKAGYSVTFKGDVCTILNKCGQRIGVIHATQNGLYKVEHAYMASTLISKMSNVLNSLKTLISLEKYGLETAWNFIFP